MKKALIFSPVYQDPYLLPATPNDRSDWLETLATRGFTSLQVDPGQTRTAVIAALQTFSSSLTRGDAGAIILLGHGGRLRGSEPDGFDECYVPPDILAIRDNELASIIRPALTRGAKVDVVSEFCYSGTSTDAALRTWCACGPAQLAWWGYFSGIERSFFSAYLCWALRNYPAYTASQLIVVVKSYVTGYISSQVPQLDGPSLKVVPF